MRSLLALLPLASAQDLFLKQEVAKKDAEVLIVGAGWSGMSAAHQLAQHGVSFKIIEAREYTGGRTHSIQFGDPSVSVNTMEIGSGWLESSGTKGGPENAPPPLWTASQAMSPPLKVAFVPGSSQNMSNYQHVYTVDGKLADTDGKIRDAANAAYACIGAASGKGKTDPTVRHALEACGWKPDASNEIDQVIDWALTVDDPGMVASQQALSLTLPDPVYDWWGPDDHFIIDQRPRGYAGVLDDLTKDTVKSEDIIFNTKVRNVAYDSKGVTITAEDGTTYTADVAITTFPLGVLNRQHRELFTPNVPSKLAKVLDSGTFIMSNLTRIYLQFPEVFWDNSASKWLAANGDGDAGEFPEYVNFNHADRVPGSNTLLLFLGNPESVKYENMEDADVSAAVMKKLRKQFPKAVDPVAFHITRWGLDPLAFGCYSTLKPGFVDDSYSSIVKPLKAGKHSKVYMAGEAMCDDLSGSTYGAYQSGRQQALTYLHTAGKVAHKPKEICWA